MKEVKAYVRPERVEAVVAALHGAGLAHLSIIHVRSFGSGVDPDDRRMSLEAGEWYTENAKLEFVCAEPDAPELVEVIRGAAHTGHPGDGIVFVSGVDRAVKIRSGTEGRDALAWSAPRA